MKDIAKLIIALTLSVFSLVSLTAEPTITFAKGLDIKANMASRTYYKYSVSDDNAINAVEGFSIADKMIDYVSAPILLERPESLEEENEIYTLSKEDSSASVEIDFAKGTYFVSRGFNKYSGDVTTKGLLKGTNASEKALEHITNLGFTLNAAELGNVHVGGVNVASHKENGSVEIYEKLTTVTLRRKLNGMKVIGATRAVVQMGENGELQSIYMNWPKLKKEPLNMRDMRPIGALMDNQIINELKAKGKDAKSIYVTEKEIVMYDDGYGHIEPVVIVNGDSNYGSNDGETIDALGTIELFIPLFNNSDLILPDAENANTIKPEM